MLPTHPPLTQAELDEQHLRTLPQPPHPKLDHAIDDGDIARIKDELDACRCRFHAEADFNTALERAITSGRINSVRLLIENSVPVTTENLETAARAGHIAVLEYLLQHIHWPVDKVSVRYWPDNAHVSLAALSVTILQLIVRTRLAVKHEDMVLWLLSKGANVNKEDGFSETPLSRAVQTGTRDVIKVLLDAGADVTRGAPLHASLLRREGDGNLELMSQLLELGAPVDKFLGQGSVIWETAGFEQMTALHLACDGSHRNLAAVRLLLAHGADPTLNKRLHGVEIPHTSAFDSASHRGHADIASVMSAHVSRDCDTS